MAPSLYVRMQCENINKKVNWNEWQFYEIATIQWTDALPGCHNNIMFNKTFGVVVADNRNSIQLKSQIENAPIALVAITQLY